MTSHTPTSRRPPRPTTPGPELAASLRSALARAADLADADQRRLVLQMGTFAGSVATGPVRTLPASARIRRGTVVLGSRGAGRGENPALYVAADAATWEQVAAWLCAHPLPRPIAGFDLPWPVHGDAGVDGVWEAVLHPDVDASGPHLVPAGAHQLAAFAAAVAAVGGTVERGPRATGNLTWLPVRLPDTAAAERLGRFNPLRSLRPMGHIRLR